MVNYVHNNVLRLNIIKIHCSRTMYDIYKNSVCRKNNTSRIAHFIVVRFQKYYLR